MGLDLFSRYISIVDILKSFTISFFYQLGKIGGDIRKFEFSLKFIWSYYRYIYIYNLFLEF